MDLAKQKHRIKEARRFRIRKKISGTAQKPRLCIRKSLKNMFAQMVDDVNGRSLVQVGSLSKEVLDRKGESKGKIILARLVGNVIAEKAQEQGIKKVVFDRGGNRYHGRVKAVADGAREKGLEF